MGNSSVPYQSIPGTAKPSSSRHLVLTDTHQRQAPTFSIHPLQDKRTRKGVERAVTVVSTSRTVGQGCVWQRASVEWTARVEAATIEATLRWMVPVCMPGTISTEHVQPRFMREFVKCREYSGGSFAPTQNRDTACQRMLKPVRALLFNHRCGLLKL